MKEDFLQFIWKFGLYKTVNLQTTYNQPVEILSRGSQNTIEGPDFLNAKIKIGDTLWAGNVEIHINSSDWYKHNHQNNENYNSIILHVVSVNDQNILRSNGMPIPCLVLNYPDGLYQRYLQLINSYLQIPCANMLPKIDRIHLNNWLTRLASERLERKCSDIKSILIQNNNDWSACFYQLLFKYFGLGANALPFEMLFKSIPSNYLLKQHTLHDLEAILFGQAGLLDPPIDQTDNDQYFISLQNQYAYLKNKLQLQSIDAHLWKWGGLRPSNFPTIRLAQLAHLLSNTKLLDTVLNPATSGQILTSLLSDVNASSYWDQHYQFNKNAKKNERKKIGKSTQLGINSNLFIPYLFTYAQQHGLSQLEEHVFDLFQQLPAETNSIIKQWEAIGIKAKDNLESQALIQLTNEYCTHKQCLKCTIGKFVVENKAKLV